MKGTRRFIAVMTLFSVLTVGSGVLWGQGNGPAPSAQSSETQGQVNLNTAGAEELATLPGIGPVIAQRIVDHRAKNGKFKRLEDVMAVQGIGERKFLRLKDRVTL
ncbi:MAG: helix-hairpin-helix domain-containing protein [Acidobacteria bacterium]|nr:helix-hairpin-helix domain-containing protein [Acidobacteriota bacterium]